MMAWLWPLGLLLFVLTIAFVTTPPPSGPDRKEKP